jgi:hypothetical protein
MVIAFAVTRPRRMTLNEILLRRDPPQRDRSPDFGHFPDLILLAGR